MIITQIIGGLGNQMFQYALARNLSLKNNTELELDLSWFKKQSLRHYDLGHLNICEKIAIESNIRIQKSGYNNYYLFTINQYLNAITTKLKIKPIFQHKGFIEESRFSFIPEILTKKGELYLKGYWQSEKYFANIREILLKDFQPQNSPSNENAKLISAIEASQSISLHVRRGDYIQNAETNDLHGSCSIKYYQNSVDYLKNHFSDPHLFIFSDDPAWARANLSELGKQTIVDVNDDATNYEDMRLMSKCKYNIIANSSFSWWGAWLNQNPNKIVIAPAKWFKSKEHNTNDVIPEDWVKIKPN